MPSPDRAQPLAIARLDQKRDDRSDDEDRLEPFTKNDQERLEECAPSAACRPGQLDDSRQIERNRSRAPSPRRSDPFRGARP